jgi:hypothetical protein
VTLVLGQVFRRDGRLWLRAHHCGAEQLPDADLKAPHGGLDSRPPIRGCPSQVLVDHGELRGGCLNLGYRVALLGPHFDPGALVLDGGQVIRPDGLKGGHAATVFRAQHGPIWAATEIGSVRAVPHARHGTDGLRAARPAVAAEPSSNRRSISSPSPSTPPAWRTRPPGSSPGWSRDPSRDMPRPPAADRGPQGVNDGSGEEPRTSLCHGVGHHGPGKQGKIPGVLDEHLKSKVTDGPGDPEVGGHVASM